MTAPDKQFIEEINPSGILSFATGGPSIPLNRLNILIGPNGSGKSNFIELFELLSSAPTDLAKTIRDGGGVREWLWRGDIPANAARIGVRLQLPKVAQTLYPPTDFYQTRTIWLSYLTA